MKFTYKPILNRFICNNIFYFTIRHTAKILANIIKRIDRNQGEIMAIDSKIAIKLPNIQLRFC